MSRSGLGGDARSNAVAGGCPGGVQDSLDDRTRPGATSSSDEQKLRIDGLDMSWQVTRSRHPDGGLDGERPSSWAKRTVRIVAERVDAAIREELRLRYVTTFNERRVWDGRSTVPASLAESQRTHMRNEDGT